MLGAGGAGTVWKSYDLEQHEYVAVKIQGLDKVGKLHSKRVEKMENYTRNEWKKI
jgi:hypothetical protein